MRGRMACIAGGTPDSKIIVTSSRTQPLGRPGILTFADGGAQPGLCRANASQGRQQTLSSRSHHRHLITPCGGPNHILPPEKSRPICQTQQFRDRRKPRADCL
ncbi:hypothetical protein COCC4DRAFT_148854 [Bipolaris maydis ATCC 48331]|uniref:Uncharacterized protein n=2 Tax=Cochliobolus heterostrophus TaxID=5016 RepID=M2V366_COCH5|nr:uncharacterized protein COCC4DRAFT_148854 [Bipolaris maydis ATCC 48331]EMD94478.1 hypothetical protein COCHEDRAFT_1028362 [Bipolaris maydis C5]ENI01180.1 hypothetical protein COCC4DRAFT_148854 [Bipolaris maydis ATCC 48331]